MHRSLCLFLAVAILTACGDSTGPDGTEPPAPTYESIAATYNGALAGLAQGVTLQATFSVTIQQTAGTLSGSWSLTGTLTEGALVVPVQGTGSLTGTIALGNNPSVNITIMNACPNYQAAFSGAYDSANRLLTISGPIEFYTAGTCTVFLSYQSTILLSR